MWILLTLKSVEIIERNTLAVSFVSWEWPGRESGWDGNFSWNEFIERIIQRPHPECLGQFG